MTKTIAVFVVTVFLFTALGYAQLQANTKTTGIEHEDIGIAPNNSESHDPGITILEARNTQGFGDGVRGRIPEQATNTDVIIKGSKIKENYVDKDHKDWIDILSAGVKDDQDLELYAAATAATDENIEEIKFNFQKIEMKYKYPAKLFGFLPIEYTATATAEEIYPDEYGRVKVHFPWWSIFTDNPAKNLETELNSQLPNVDLQNPVQKQRILQTMSNIMKTKHDTARAAIQNVR